MKNTNLWRTFCQNELEWVKQKNSRPNISVVHSIQLWQTAMRKFVFETNYSILWICCIFFLWAEYCHFQTVEMKRPLMCNSWNLSGNVDLCCDVLVNEPKVLLLAKLFCLHSLRKTTFISHYTCRSNPSPKPFPLIIFHNRNVEKTVVLMVETRMNNFS